MKRNALLVFVLCLVGKASYSQKKEKDSALIFCYFNNNGEDGLHLAYSKNAFEWKALNNDNSFLKPTAGIDKLMRDPCIVRGGDGLFHMVWTVSWNEKSIGYASSKDLIHWSTQQDIPVMAHEPDALNCWAPEIFYDAASGDYMIYWATTIPGRFPVGDTTGDSKYNHRIYYVRTKDFRNFTKAAVLYDKNFNVIDATIQKDGDTYIMFLKNETLKPTPEKNIRIATSNQLTTGYSEASKPITGNYWAEGPTAVKWKGQWFVYFDKYTQHTYGLITSTDLKEWKDMSEKFVYPKGLKHGTVFKVSGKELERLLEQ